MTNMRVFLLILINLMDPTKWALTLDNIGLVDILRSDKVKYKNIIYDFFKFKKGEL